MWETWETMLLRHLRCHCYCHSRSRSHFPLSHFPTPTQQQEEEEEEEEEGGRPQRRRRKGGRAGAGGWATPLPVEVGGLLLALEGLEAESRLA